MLEANANVMSARGERWSAYVLRAALVFAGAVFLLACETLLKAPDAEYADMRFERYVKAPAPRAGARFGQTLALDDESLVASAPFEDVARSGGRGDAERAG